MESIPIVKKKKRMEASGVCEQKSGEEVGNLIKRVSEEVNPYARWSNPIIDELPALREELRKLVFALHPVLFLNLPDFILQRIREDNDRLIHYYYARAGGWQAIERDMKKAERWILEMYERELKEGEV